MATKSASSNHRYAMIMAGGAGTRLWPMSRADRPKQLIPFIHRNGKPVSLLGLAAERLEGLVPREHRFICTGEAYREAIRASMPEFSNDRILGEPAGRDTVNAVGFAAAVLHKLDPRAIFAVLTADHLIEPVEKFQKCMDTGFRLVEEDPLRLVTFSIKPTYPATGYGYVERGTPVPGFANTAFRVERFVEKPNLQRAQAYLESGAFGWNSGMFVWSADTFLNCLRRYKPESHGGLMKIADAWGTPRQQEVLREVYPTLPKISVDYAIMEPASREQSRTAGTTNASGSIKIVTVIMDLKWLDVGSWPSYAETLEADADGNRSTGPGLFAKCRNSMVANESKHHFVAMLGCENLIVVHTDDATLVMPRDKAEELKTLFGELPESLK